MGVLVVDGCELRPGTASDEPTGAPAAGFSEFISPPDHGLLVCCAVAATKIVLNDPVVRPSAVPAG